jgi:hypothetical protein
MGHFTTRVGSRPSTHDAPVLADTSHDDPITKSAGPAGITERLGVSPVSTSTLLILVTVGFLALQAIVLSIDPIARDPGVRGGADGAGREIQGLTAFEIELFNAGLAEFAEVDDVDEGLGPRMNLDSCGNCHLAPAVGGSSPAVNPQVAFANKDGGTTSFRRSFR